MLFSERLKIHKDFIKWAKEYSVEPNAFSTIIYLDVMGRLNSWIPATDGLPEVDCDVLLTVDRYSPIVDDWIIGDVVCSSFDKTTGKFWIEKDFVEHPVKVKAWMLLPAPYKEDKEGGIGYV